MADVGLLIIGAGGHGKVVADAALASGMWKRVAFLDDGMSPGTKVTELEVIGGIEDMDTLGPTFSDLTIASGDHEIRMRLLTRAAERGYNLPVVVHPSAAIAPSARIGEGTVVMAQAAINADAEIGQGVIINTGAIVEHDCRIGDGAHLSPGAAMGGEARIGDAVWLGMNSSVLPRVSVGDNSIVGGGAVVVKDLPAGVTAIGVPARTTPE